jgi:hypothetical protein
MDPKNIGSLDGRVGVGFNKELYRRHSCKCGGDIFVSEIRLVVWKAKIWNPNSARELQLQPVNQIVCASCGNSQTKEDLES